MNYIKIKDYKTEPEPFSFVPEPSTTRVCERKKDNIQNNSWIRYDGHVIKLYKKLFNHNSEITRQKNILSTHRKVEIISAHK